MDISYCKSYCPMRLYCVKDSNQKDMNQIFEKSNYNKLIKKIVEKLSDNSDFTLKMGKLVVEKNGLSGSYDIYINNIIVDTLSIESNNNICFPFFCLQFISQIKCEIEKIGFSSKYINFLQPYSEISFNRRYA